MSGLVGHGERSCALLVGAGAVLLVTARSWAATTAHGHPSAYTWAAPGWVLASLAWGAAVRSRRQHLASLAGRAELAEAGREAEARRRVAAERLRIARELHDVIGHSFAVVNVQARAAAAVLDRDPAQARSALSVIESASRTALQEIRHALGLLRDPQETADRGPSAGLDPITGAIQLERLVAPLRGRDRRGVVRRHRRRAAATASRRGGLPDRAGIGDQRTAARRGCLGRGTGGAAGRHRGDRGMQRRRQAAAAQMMAAAGCRGRPGRMARRAGTGSRGCASAPRRSAARWRPGLRPAADSR
jgi:hypothetical protein